MNRYLKSFLLRGLAFGGFGPVITGIVFFILNYTLNDFSLDGAQVFLAIVSTYILAFVHAGASVFNQIEHWPIAKSLLCHLTLLYVAYCVCYLVNSWIPFEPVVILTFSAIFAVGYFAVWLTVYFTVKHIGNRLNERIG